MSTYLIIGASSGIGKKLAEQLIDSDQKREANALRHPLKTTGTACNIADRAAFLFSEEGSWISGQVLHNDGGMTALKI